MILSPVDETNEEARFVLGLELSQVSSRVEGSHVNLVHDTYDH